MEVYELPITSEESKNYYGFFEKLKALGFVDWVEAYISAVILCVTSAFVLAFVSSDYLLYVWYGTGTAVKIVLFAVLFLVTALKRSRSKQLNAMLKKYLIDNVPKELINSRIQLKKVKVHKNHILVYYCKYNEQHGEN